MACGKNSPFQGLLLSGMLAGLTVAVCANTTACAAGAPGALERPVEFGLPVRCTVGRTCFVQQYFDHGTLAPKDYRCGSRVYAGHDGTDIRIPTLLDMQGGVPVVAAAAGVIRGVRDGMADGQFLRDGQASIAGHECGNGVTIAHGRGWETQYCHLRRGSVTVQAGQPVKAGAILGSVGESGAAAFAHLHFTARRNGTAVDPFAWNAPPGRCAPGQSLWSPQAAQDLDYHATELINSGFSTSAVSLNDIETGRTLAMVPDTNAPALVAFARAIGLRAGDVQILELRTPTGDILARSAHTPLEKDAAERMLVVGKRRSPSPWPAGRYSARYTIVRNDVTVVDRTFSADLGPPSP